MDNSARFFGCSYLTIVLLSVTTVGCAKHEMVMDASLNRAISAPTVTVTEPIATPMASNVATNSRIAVTFNKDMDPATVSASTFKVTCGDGREVDGVVTYLPSSRMASFTPVVILPTNTICTAAILAGVQDTTGTALAKAFIWTFMTA